MSIYDDLILKVKDILVIWESSKNSDAKLYNYNLANTYLLMDIALTLRDISSGIHSIDAKTT